MFLTTALFNQMAKERKGVMGRLRNILFGGEMVDVGSVRQVMEEGKPERLIHVYGPTESTTFATWYEVERGNEKGGSIPIGRGITNTRVYIMDEGQEVVPVGVRGELCIGGEGLARGYYGSAKMTAEKFVPDWISGREGERLYRTGDEVMWNEVGEVEFIGRKDQQVKVRGYRIEMGEIEAALMSMQEIKEAVVVAKQTEGGDKRLIGYVVAEQEEVNRREVMRQLRERLPEYMVPSGIIVLDEMPLSESGKINRRALPEPDFINLGLEASFIAPRSEMEKKIAEIWQQVLGMEKIGVNDNFFEVGGNSLSILRAQDRLEQVLGHKVLPTELFRYPTISLLAAHLDQSSVETLPNDARQAGSKRKALMKQNKERGQKRTAVKKIIEAPSDRA
jgi:acyl carrier protein